jgi:hypothetical protein
VENFREDEWRIEQEEKRGEESVTLTEGQQPRTIIHQPVKKQ